jgi:proline iminopeptidase
VFNIVQFSQRGCGQSTPYAELTDNTTQASVHDMERLREHLSIDRWHVFGGSWGSTLSLIYAQHHPERVISLVLRGIFMCRKSELHWFYQDGASHIFPDAFEPYRTHIPEAERSDLIRAYYARLTSDDVEVRRAAAKEWTRWEMATSRLFPDPEYLEKAEDLDFAVAFARIECHYFINAIFVEEAHILNHVDRLQEIPTVIVQGRYDVVCPTRSAWELHQAMPHSNLVIVPDAGHSMGEVSIARELVAATDALR